MTKEQLKKIAIHATQKNVDLFFPYLSQYMREFGIEGKLRESAFIAQVLHESGSFKYVKEIASGKAYEGRKDLGNTQPGDGVRYKGRGLIQITGRANYKQAGDALKSDLINYPESLERSDMAVRSACWWWCNRGLNDLADQCEFIKITKKINGGTNGLAERKEYYSRALEVL